MPDHDPRDAPDSPDSPDSPAPHDRRPLLDLSLPQLVAGATAAATSAVLIGRMGMLGTVLGAALASVVSAVVTSGLVGGWHRVRTVPSRFPRNVNGMVVTALALGLVLVAFRTGVGLVSQDLPTDTFAGRWLAEVGLSRG